MTAQEMPGSVATASICPPSWASCLDSIRLAVSPARHQPTRRRALLIHGCRAVLRYAPRKTDPQGLWLQELMARRGHNCAAVALANGNARIIQALLCSDAPYMRRGATAQSQNY